MDDMESQVSEPAAAKTSAPKDKNCPFCGQAFTSSSLGRHLDLYIKEKNPKPEDGVHDVEAIRKLRGGITRRQPRGSIIARKDPTPSKRSRPSSKREAAARDKPTVGKPVPRSGSYDVDSASSKYPLLPSWEASGAIDDISAKGPATTPTVLKQATPETQLEMRHKLADAMDTARAAELALRELLGSVRLAKHHVVNHSNMPFDFDPLALDFPALTLRCLQSPPTLFSSTQYPTSTSWFVQSPGQREFNALRVFFEEGFKAWKTSRAPNAMVVGEDLTPAASSYTIQKDNREAMKRAEKAANDLEKSVEQHLQSVYTVWDSLPGQKQQEIWILELARGVGRKHMEIENLKEQHHLLKQENAYLKVKIEQLNQLNQSRESQLPSPTSIPIERDVTNHSNEQGAKAGKPVGFDMMDRRFDVSTLAARSIERWKNVIASTRATFDGTGAQRLSNEPSHGSPTGSPSRGMSRDVPQPQQQQQKQKQQQQQQHRQDSVSQQSTSTGKRPSIASTAGLVSENTACSASTPGPPSIEDEMTDQDADAEMEDDDSFAMMSASCVKHPHTHPALHQSVGLDIPRTQELLQQQGSAPDMRFMMQSGVANSIGPTMGMTRSMSNMNIAMQASHLQGGDMSLMQQVRSDTLYMDNGM